MQLRRKKREFALPLWTFVLLVALVVATSEPVHSSEEDDEEVSETVIV